MVTSLILHDSIETTEAKAKAIKPIMDHLMSVVKKNDDKTAIRYLNSYLFDKAASRKVMEVLKDKYKDKHSGFTRIRRVKLRTGDAAQVVQIELI